MLGQLDKHILSNLVQFQIGVIGQACDNYEWRSSSSNVGCMVDKTVWLSLLSWNLPGKIFNSFCLNEKLFALYYAVIHQRWTPTLLGTRIVLVTKQIPRGRGTNFGSNPSPLRKRSVVETFSALWFATLLSTEWNRHRIRRTSTQSLNAAACGCVVHPGSTGYADHIWGNRVDFENQMKKHQQGLLRAWVAYYYTTVSIVRSC